MKITAIFLFLFFTLTATAGTLSFEGIVKDSKGNPLEMANLLAVNKHSGKTEAYAITDEKGRFQLRLQAYTDYTIQVSFVGFQIREIALSTKDHDIVELISLEEGITLEGVEIVYEMPVRISGDTVQYHADSFSNGTERKLEDILKKLPGVEVRNGEVTMEGKPVGKLLVEGRDFFEGDVSIGSRNIPADAVDKIEMLKNYSEVSQLKGLENNKDDIAMNIRLKEDKKNFWFGELPAGGGTKWRYAANPKLFYYRPRYSFNAIGNFNTIGEVPFSLEDYFKFTGGLKKLLRQGSGTSFMTVPQELLSLLEAPLAKEAASFFTGASFTVNPSKFFDIGGFGIYSSNTILTDKSDRRSILDAASGQTLTTQFSDYIKRQKTSLAMFKIAGSYTPDERLRIDYDALLKTSRLSQCSSIVSRVEPREDQSQQLTEESGIAPFSVMQSLNLYHIPENKDVVSASVQYTHERQAPDYYADMAVPPFPFDGYIPQQRSRLRQTRGTRTNKLDARLDYYYRLNPASHLQFELGGVYAKQDYASQLFQEMDNGNMNDLGDLYYNRVDYNFRDAYAGLYYKLKMGRLTVRPGVSFHFFVMDNTQPGSGYRKKSSRLLPDIDLTWDVNRSSLLEYNFAIINNYNQGARLGESYVLSDYNTLIKGNGHLLNAFSQKHTLRFSFFNRYSMSNGNVMVDYRRDTDAVTTHTDFTGVNATTRLFNSDYVNESLKGHLSYGRSFFTNYKGKADAELSWSKSYNSQNSDGTALSQVPLSLFTQGYTILAMTNFEDLPSLTLGYNLEINTYPDDVFYTKKPFMGVAYSFCSDAMSFTANYELFDYSNKRRTASNKYEFLSAAFSYRNKPKTLEYKLAGTNLLNTDVINSNTFDTYATYNSANRIQPRYIIFSVIYKI